MLKSKCSINAIILKNICSQIEQKSDENIKWIYNIVENKFDPKSVNTSNKECILLQQIDQLRIEKKNLASNSAGQKVLQYLAPTT